MPRTKKFNVEEVLEKATDLFWEKGYHATSIQDLVDHLGINRGSIYDTYGGKEALFTKALNHYIDINNSMLQEFLDAFDDVREGFRKLMSRAIEEAKMDCNKKGCFVVNTTTELLPTDDSMITKIVNANNVAIENIFEAYLKKGVEKNQIDQHKDLKTIASLFFTFLNGMRVITKVETDDKRLYQSIDTILKLLD